MPKKTLTLLWIGVLAASCSVVPKGKSLPPLPPRAEYALVGELGKETVEGLDAVERVDAVEGLDAVLRE